MLFPFAFILTTKKRKGNILARMKLKQEIVIVYENNFFLHGVHNAMLFNVGYYHLCVRVVVPSPASPSPILSSTTIGTR